MRVLTELAPDWRSLAIHESSGCSVSSNRLRAECPGYVATQYDPATPWGQSHIHGYRSDFDDALDRTVTLRNLNAYSVPTVSVVWPSRKRYLSYLYDASSIAWSQGYIDSLLLELVE